MNQNRDLTIRYIGGAIVISVAAGMTTLELQRRWQTAARKRSQQKAFSDQQTLALSAEWSERSAEMSPIHQGQSHQGQTLDTQNTSETELAPGWLSELIASSTHADQMLWSDFQTPGSATAQPGTIIEQAEDLPTCHIWSTDQQRRLLAVQFEGQYYSFFRLFTTRAEAWDAAQQLSMQQHQLMITQADQMYALWVLQPEAQIASLLI